MGIARAALDEFVALAQEKKSQQQHAIAERSHTQMQIATAEAKLRSARAFYYDSLEQAWFTPLRATLSASTNAATCA